MFGQAFLQHFGTAGNMAAGANTGNQRIDRRVGEIGENFLRCSADMDVDIGRVFELLRHPCTGRVRNQFHRAFDGALHPLFTRGQVKARAISQHQPPAFDATSISGITSISLYL